MKNGNKEQRRVSSTTATRPLAPIKQEHILREHWWFVYAAFPLVSATFAPLANLFSVCAILDTWLVFQAGTGTKPRRIDDPSWLIALNSISLAFALAANVLLLLNYAHRIRYTLAQPFTIIFWYIAAVLLLIPLGILRRFTSSSVIFSQSYYYGVLSCSMYFSIATLLLLSHLPSFTVPVCHNTFPACPAAFLPLTLPQHTLMLQSLFFTLYLALGAGVFSSINGWAFVDGLYWADYTLLTIGYGSDFPLKTRVSRGLVIPYAAFGILSLGLVIASVHELVVSRVRERMLYGKEIVQRERDRWRRAQLRERKEAAAGPWWGRKWFSHKDARVDSIASRIEDPLPKRWGKEEWETMRDLRVRIDRRRRYVSLFTSLALFLVIWLGGALVFWFTERNEPQQASGGYTFPLSLYFTYITLLTIGYGDVFPQSNAGKPFFVLWSLIAVPAVTMLISNVGETVGRWVQHGPIERVIGRWVIGDVSENDDLSSSETSSIDNEKASEARGTKKQEKEMTHRARAGNTSDQDLGCSVKEQKAIVLMREIKRVFDDDEGTNYTWKEWARWIKLLALDDQGDEQGDISGWTWLGDNGPLFGRKGLERAWLLKKLGERLETLIG
ncbi:hypothetical protein AX17_005181 [Amanita inopinata Kibby_2008]|nr:hypothetical protein AX17_005181 [Amanita inopinata Kibby_2008]